jgi:DNA replication protein DnaC
VREHNHRAIVGPTGRGKSWLACALGNKACRDGFSVLSGPRRRPLGAPDDHVGAYQSPHHRRWGPEPLAAEQRHDLLEIVDDRYDKGSLLITSQVPVPHWHDIVADPTLGDAILDRIIHNAHRIELKGDSLRRHAGEKKTT